jgi:hypothetical protein
VSHWPGNRAFGEERAKARAADRAWPARLGSYLLLQLFALFVFVGFPAFWTAVAPVSYVRFERRDGQASATVHTCLLFIVPYKTQTVDAVVHIGDRFVTGTYERRGTDHDHTKSEDEGFLIIQGHDHAAEVSVSPHDLKSVIEQAKAFLEDPQAAELKLFVVANWKFSVIGGGLLSLLTVLYVVSIAFGLLVKAIHVVQWSVGVPSERRWLAKAMKRT